MTHRESHLAEGLFDLKKTPGDGLCMVKGCRKPSEPKKMGLCHCHWQFRWRMKSRKRSAYSTLRDHAKARGLEFTISFDYFLGMTDCVAFWSPSESRGEQLSIDRIDPRKGYVPSNIQIVSISENSRKSNRERYLPGIVQAYLDRKRQRANEKMSEFMEEPDCPF